MAQVTAFAPATVANLSAGYDILGMALEEPGDEVTVSWSTREGVHLTAIEGDGGALPADARRNTAGVAVQSLLDSLGEKRGIDLQLRKGMPLCSGLGSSAASAAAAVFAVNELLGRPLSTEELVAHAAAGEAAASGAPHADNVGPSLLGGVVLVQSATPARLVSIPLAGQLFYAVVHPELEVRTKEARTCVPKEVSISIACEQMARAAGFAVALTTGDWALLRTCLFDALAEPARAVLIPGFSLIREAALKAGALGAGLSGSGPSMYALAESRAAAEASALAMQGVFEKQGIVSHAMIGQVGAAGARVIRREA
jgi:homoserine kinase